MQTFNVLRMDEAGGQLADSMSFRASGPPFSTSVGQSPTVLVQSRPPHAARASVVAERRAGWACPAQVEKGGPEARNDMEQDWSALAGAIAQALERPLSAATAKGKKEP